MYTYYCNGKQKEIKDIYKMDEYLFLKQRINIEHITTVYVNIKNIKYVN